MKKTFSLWRILAVTAAAIVIAGGIAWHTGFIHPLGLGQPSNSIMVIMPYQHAGTWVFDDPAVGLRKEPFVAGIPEMINELAKDIPDADKGFRMLFSAQPFPGHSLKLIWKAGDRSGNWYYSEQLQKEGWLCPGLFKYYRQAPKELYVKAEKK
jgi:hypothetical protein